MRGTAAGYQCPECLFVGSGPSHRLLDMRFTDLDDNVQVEELELQCELCSTVWAEIELRAA